MTDILTSKSITFPNPSLYSSSLPPSVWDKVSGSIPSWHYHSIRTGNEILRSKIKKTINSPSKIARDRTVVVRPKKIVFKSYGRAKSDKKVQTLNSKAKREAGVDRGFHRGVQTETIVGSIGSRLHSSTSGVSTSSKTVHFSSDEGTLVGKP